MPWLGRLPPPLRTQPSESPASQLTHYSGEDRGYNRCVGSAGKRMPNPKCTCVDCGCGVTCRCGTMSLVRSNTA